MAHDEEGQRVVDRDTGDDTEKLSGSRDLLRGSPRRRRRGKKGENQDEEGKGEKRKGKRRWLKEDKEEKNK